MFSALLNILCTAYYLVLEFFFGSFENFILFNKELFYSWFYWIVLSFLVTCWLTSVFNYQVVCSILCLWVWPLEIDNFFVMPMFPWSFIFILDLHFCFCIWISRYLLNSFLIAFSRWYVFVVLILEFLLCFCEFVSALVFFVSSFEWIFKLFCPLSFFLKGCYTSSL